MTRCTRHGFFFIDLETDEAILSTDLFFTGTGPSL